MQFWDFHAHPTWGNVAIFLVAGGVIWSWFYLRYRHIWPGYVSHVLADVAIFIMTWIIVFA